MDDALAPVREALSNIFMVPASWFEGPAFVVNFIFPLLGMIGVFYLLLSKKLRIFRNGAVNLTLSVLLALTTVPFFIVPFPYAVIFFSVLGVIAMLGDRITGRTLVVAFVAAFAALLLATYSNYIISMIFA